jgi:hypothetical protein
MKPRKRNSALAEKRAKESTMAFFPLLLQFFGAMSETYPRRGMMLFAFLQPVPQSGRKAKISCLSC